MHCDQAKLGAPAMFFGAQLPNHLLSLSLGDAGMQSLVVLSRQGNAALASEIQLRNSEEHTVLPYVDENTVTKSRKAAAAVLVLHSL